MATALLPPTHPTVPAAAASRFGVAASEILTKLSFSHIVELLPCDDPTKRAFYELECIRGNWSVRELKRQIASLYYERAGLSTDPAKLAARAHVGTEPAPAAASEREHRDIRCDEDHRLEAAGGLGLRHGARLGPA